MMGRLISISIITASVCLFSGTLVMASTLQETFNESLQDTAKETGHLDLAISQKSPGEIIAKVIKTALAFLGVIFLILMIYGGFKWMLSGGNDQAIGDAKKIIKNGFIGLLIVVAAYGVTMFLGSLLTSATGQ